MREAAGHEDSHRTALDIDDRDNTCLLQRDSEASIGQKE